MDTSIIEMFKIMHACMHIVCMGSPLLHQQPRLHLFTIVYAL